jgi:hypothetical protein
MQICNLSPCTQATYLQQITQFAVYFGKSPELLGPEDIRTYQLYLTNERKLATGSIHLAISALRFLYTVASGATGGHDPLHRQADFGLADEGWSVEQRHDRIALYCQARLQGAIECGVKVAGPYKPPEMAKKFFC